MFRRSDKATEEFEIFDSSDASTPEDSESEDWEGEDEDKESLCPKEQDSDPLMEAKVKIAGSSIKDYGQVVSVKVSRSTGERHYLVRFEEGNFEYFTQEHIASLKQNYMRSPMKLKELKPTPREFMRLVKCSNIREEGFRSQYQTSCEKIEALGGYLYSSMIKMIKAPKNFTKLLETWTSHLNGRCSRI